MSIFPTGFATALAIASAAGPETAPPVAAVSALPPKFLTASSPTLSTFCPIVFFSLDLFVSYDQFRKDICDNKKLYDEYTLPTRSTKNSAGYDFVAINDFQIKPGEIKKIPLGIKVQMNEDEVLFLIVRSSMGFKYNVRMTNQIGVIDSDYYNNETNEGHMWISLQNEGKEDFIVKKGDHIVQGIFMKYLTVDDEEEINNVRISGFGSTN